MRFQTIALGVAVASLVAGCSASPKSFYANPSRTGATQLCRTFLETSNAQFQQSLADEINRRGLTYEDCESRVAMENAALTTIAVVAVGAAALGSGATLGPQPRRSAFAGGTAFLKRDLGVQGLMRHCQYSNGEVYTVNAVDLCSQSVDGPTFSPNGKTGFLQREYEEGMTKVCVYEVLGDEHGVRQNGVSLCAPTHRF